MLKQSEIDKLTIGRHLIDRGLYLQVSGPNARSWLFRYQFQGKPRWLGLGSAADVTLKQALAARDDAKATLRRLVDPVAERQKSKAAGTHAGTELDHVCRACEGIPAGSRR